MKGKDVKVLYPWQNIAEKFGPPPEGGRTTIVRGLGGASEVTETWSSSQVVEVTVRGMGIDGVRYSLLASAAKAVGAVIADSIPSPRK